MTNEHDEMPWSPAFFTEQMQKASEEFTDQQMKLFSQMLSASSGANTNGSSSETNPFGDFTNFGNFSKFGPMGAAVFKTRVQSGGRISIPDAEREALDIDEGDIVQTFVVPIKRTRGDSNE